MPYLFDTDAVSEVLRKQPHLKYLEWLRGIPREDQLTSAVVVAELFKGAYKSPAKERHLSNIEDRVLKSLTVLPFDTATAKVFGLLRAHLDLAGTPVDDPDLQIAATAVHHGLELVTGNLKRFKRIPGLKTCEVLDMARRDT